jgi:hypothetical protein
VALVSRSGCSMGPPYKGSYIGGHRPFVTGYR